MESQHIDRIHSKNCTLGSNYLPPCRPDSTVLCKKATIEVSVETRLGTFGMNGASTIIVMAILTQFRLPLLN